MEVLNFYFRRQSYCLDIVKISEILNSAAIYPLPGTPRALEGLFQVRGNIISLFNFSVSFGEEDRSSDSQIIVFAEPFAQFAVRVPAPVETKSLNFGDIQFPEESSPLLAILEGSCSDGAEIHHLISPEELIIEVKDMLKDWKDWRETEGTDRG